MCCEASGCSDGTCVGVEMGLLNPEVKVLRCHDLIWFLKVIIISPVIALTVSMGDLRLLLENIYELCVSLNY